MGSMEQLEPVLGRYASHASSQARAIRPISLQNGLIQLIHTEPSAFKPAAEIRDETKCVQRSDSRKPQFYES